ncbi:MAG TPA: carboxylesterase family protein [Terracidiphilus sp.]|nr:carboxylesterase family protein [Terracidiphilus sp.]
MSYRLAARSIHRISGSLLVALLFTVPLAAQEVVTIQTGKIKGMASEGLIAFKGIPFAAPPVGDLRWRPPQPAASWDGVRSAADYAHDCMQLPFPSDAAPLGTPPAEDCLYLNVWSPAPRAASPMPVMVWIYGGGFVNGGSSPAVYDGSQFARDGIVFVSFNYRLGRFGFFAHPALTKENPDGLLGNYAYMDQLAALRWVQNNIAAFGGDPNNVTVFGESAGGGSVHMLLTSPLAKGLFAKAIIESGGGRRGFGGGSPHLHEAANGKPSAEDTGLAFAEAKGITGNDAAALKKLRALPADAIVDGLNMASMMQAAKTYAGPMIDGKIVTEENSDAYLAGTQQHVPVIVGVNSLEFGFMRGSGKDDPFAQFGAKAAEARAAYDPNHTGDVTWAGASIMSDKGMVEPARFVAHALSQAGQPVFEYRFSYVATSMRKDWPAGAVHASEIPYVFDTVKARYAAALTPDDEKAAQTMHAYWVQFAKTGVPNPPSLPPWPRYSVSTDMLMNFTADGPVPEADPWKARLDLVEPQKN